MSINQLDFLSFQEPLNNLECCSNIVEKYKNYIHNKNYYVDEVDAKVARELVKKYHYSKKVVPNSKLHLGIFFKRDGRTYWCIAVWDTNECEKHPWKSCSWINARRYV